MKYRQLQAELKALRNNGIELQCKLNQKYEVLLAEWKRLNPPDPEVSNKISETTTILQEAGLIVNPDTTYNDGKTLNDFVASTGSYILAFKSNCVIVKDNTAYPLIDKPINYNEPVTAVYNVIVKWKLPAKLKPKRKSSRA